MYWIPIRFYTLVSILFFVSNAFSQNTERWCGTADDFPWLDWYHQHKTVIAERGDGDTAWLYVPVTLHIVGTDDGKGYYAVDQAVRAVCDMNARFVDARIRFYLKPGAALFYYNKSAWYEHNYGSGAELIDQNRAPGRLNAFVVSDPSGACGYYWKDAIVLRKSCSGTGNTTWAHEAGHYFSLPHTFRGWEDFNWDYSKAAPVEVNGRVVEKVDGSNCETAGDRFCDTKPDYLSDRWACNSSGISAAVQIDPDSASFRSDGSLIMSYSNDRCQARFSPEQIAAMRTNLQTKRLDHLVSDQPGAEVADGARVQLISPLDSQAVQFNNAELRWEPVPGADFYIVEVSTLSFFTLKLLTRAVFHATSMKLPENLPNNRFLYWRVRPYSYWDYCSATTSGIQTGVFRTSDLSATNELARSTSVLLSPNPVSAGAPLSLAIESEHNFEAQLFISDAAGRQLSTRPVRIFAGENRISVEPGPLSTGLYFLSLSNEKGAIVRRFAVTE